MAILHKVAEGVPDSICQQCSQCYEGSCRAYSMPHSTEEQQARLNGYGMECDPKHIKDRRTKRYGLKYRTDYNGRM